MCSAAELLRYYLDTWALVWSWCFLSLGGRRNLCTASGLCGPNGRSRPQQPPSLCAGNFLSLCTGKLLGCIVGVSCKAYSRCEQTESYLSFHKHVVYSPSLLLPQEVKTTVTGLGGCVLDQGFVVFQNTQCDTELHPSHL